MRGLNEPDNPYAGQYSEIDYWCLANAVNMDDAEAMDRLQQAWTDGFKPGEQVVYTLVSDGGFIIPANEAVSRMLRESYGDADEEQAECDGACDSGCEDDCGTACDDEEVVKADCDSCETDEGSGDDCSTGLSFMAFGTIDDDLYAAYEQEMCNCWAQYCRPVPQWLADAPPVMAKLMLDGEVVALGEPGSGLDTDVHPWQIDQSQYPWIRYAADGAEIGRMEAGSHWFALYAPELAGLVADREGEGGFISEERGFVIIYPPGDGEILYFDYLGNERSEDEYYSDEISFETEDLPGRYLPLLYAAQR